jgi:Fic-DOC domain mobile mystery protein B
VTRARSDFTPDYLPGATPLDPDEMAGLIPTYISTQGELNALEQENILRAERWLARRRTPTEVLSETFARRLHREMFGDVWRWAGEFRTSDKSIGVPWAQIPTALRNCLDNARYQLEHSVHEPDELAARLHHRLVEIHPFANGNGRHARYLADALLRALDRPAFSWGTRSDPRGIDRTGELRARYLDCLKRADRRDFAGLLAFVRD